MFGKIKINEINIHMVTKRVFYPYSEKVAPCQKDCKFKVSHKGGDFDPTFRNFEFLPWTSFALASGLSRVSFWCKKLLLRTIYQYIIKILWNVCEKRENISISII